MKQSHADNVKLFNLLSDFRPHRADEIKAVVYGSQYLGSCRISSRTKDLRSGKWTGGIKCEFVKKGKLYCWPDKTTPTLSWYQFKPPSEWDDQTEAMKIVAHVHDAGAPRGAIRTAVKPPDMPPAFDPKPETKVETANSLF